MAQVTSQPGTTLPPVTVAAPEKPRATAKPSRQAASRAGNAARRQARHAAGSSAPSVGPGTDARRSTRAPEGYVASESSVATKTDTPLIETPQSISVVTRKQLDDRGVQSLTQAIAYEPGVRTEASGFDPRFDSFSLRGFDVTYNGVYLDGLRLVPANIGLYRTEPYVIDSVTVLRGPSSALYGLGSPGGLVNLTSKLPTSTPYHEVQGLVGSLDRFQGNFDVSGPIDPQGQWLYRLTGIVRDADMITPGGKDNRVDIAPAVTWRPDASTTLTILGEYQKSKTPSSMFYYSPSSGIVSNIYPGSPSYNTFDQEQGRVGYLFEHRFDSGITFRQKMRYTDLDSTMRYVGIASVDPATQLASRYTGYVHDLLQSVGLDNQLEAKFATGPVQHTALVGYDYTWSKYKDMMGFGGGVSDLNLAAPGYAPESIPDPAISSSIAQTQRQQGIYAQDQAKFDRWILTLSGRSDWVGTSSDDLLAVTRQSQNDQAYSGRAGLTYVFDSGVAPYVSYSTSFVPNLGVNPDGGLFKPTTGKQTEVGIKYQPPGQRSFVTAAVFDLVQDGGLVTTGTGITVQRGEIRSRGLELQALANLWTGFDITSSYTYLDLKTLQAADSTTIGKMPSGIPPHTATLWANYAMPTSSSFAGLSFGGGVRYVSWSYGDDQNTFKNSSVALIDAALSYDFGQLDRQLKGLRLKLNAQNLFNRHYTTCQTGYCYIGAPQMVTAALAYRW
nr:TonB-dependent siderophore receptor [Bradyrhizobium jicamae]